MASPIPIQSIGAASSGNVTSLGVTLTPTSGNSLVAAVLARYGSAGASGPAGWTEVVAVINDSFETSIWVLEGYSGSGAQTYTWTQTVSDALEVIVYEVTSITFIDQTGSNTSNGISANPVDSGTTPTTSLANEFWFAAFGSVGATNPTISGLSSGWRQGLTENSGGSPTHPSHLTAAFQTATATGAANCELTLSTAQAWNACIATFEASGASSPYALAALADSPLRLYPCGDSASPLVDLSGNDQAATVSGSPTYAATGIVPAESAKALANASSSYATIPTTGLPTGNSPITLERWVKIPTLPSAFRGLLSVGTQTTGESFNLGINASNQLYAERKGTSINGPTAVANSVYHVVLTWDGTTLTFYVNGLKQGTATPGAATLTYGGAILDAYSDMTSKSNSVVEYAAIYGTALSQARVTAHYDTGLIARQVPASAALIATNTRTASTSAALIATATRQTPASAHLIATNTRHAPTSAALVATVNRVVPAGGALLATQQRATPTSGALLATLQRTIPATAALLATLDRAAPATAALLATLTRVAPASTALVATATRTTPANAELLQPDLQRVTPTSAAVLASDLQRSAPASGGLLAAVARTTPAAVALLASAIRAISVGARVSVIMPTPMGVGVVLVASSSGGPIGVGVALASVPSGVNVAAH